MLIKDLLVAGLLPVLDHSASPPGPEQAGRKWATAYDSYAKLATALAVPAVVSPAATLALQQDFGDAFSSSQGQPALVAARLALGAVKYWSAVTFAGMVGPPVGAAGALPFVTQFAQLLAQKSGTAASKASDIAAAFHAFTLAVVVPMPPSGNPANVT